MFHQLIYQTNQTLPFSNRCGNYAGGYGVATGGPLAWGLCFNREMSPDQNYCDESYKYEYPCAPGADYYGRGAIPIFWYFILSYPLFRLSSINLLALWVP